MKTIYICPMCCQPLTPDRTDPNKGWCGECQDTHDLTPRNTAVRDVRGSSCIEVRGGGL